MRALERPPSRIFQAPTQALGAGAGSGPLTDPLPELLVRGCPGRARTSNLLIQSQAFCQLNYRTMRMPDRA